MYESFYGLKEKPFSLLPDPDYLYLSRKHKMALTLLEYGILNQAGFCVVSGQAGAGKTTLIRYILNLFEDEINVGLLSNTHESFDELLTWILLAYDLEFSGKTKTELYQTFSDFLIEQYANNKHTVLIVDEAQNMSPQTLEELRMLSNINSEKDQLLQIILVGQPKLLENLHRPDLKQFAQRISVDYSLAPLDATETCAYIQHRLKVAGANPGIFNTAACSLIYQHSKGIPRLINMLCDTAMVYGYAEQTKTIDASIIIDVIKERETQGMLPKYEELNEETTSEYVDKLLREEEIEAKAVNLSSLEENKKQVMAALHSQQARQTAVAAGSHSSAKPAIQLVSSTVVSENVEPEKQPEIESGSASANVIHEKAESLNTMDLNQSGIAESIQDETESTGNVVEPVIAEPDQATTNDKQEATRQESTAEIEMIDEIVFATEEQETEQVEMTADSAVIKEKGNKKTKAEEIVLELEDFSISEELLAGSAVTEHRGNVRIGAAGFALGLLLSIAVVGVTVFSGGTDEPAQVAATELEQRIQMLEASTREQLEALTRERDTALAELNALQRERTATLAAAKAEEKLLAVELQTRLEIQSVQLIEEKALNVKHQAQINTLSRSIARFKQDAMAASARIKDVERELASKVAMIEAQAQYVTHLKEGKSSQVIAEAEQQAPVKLQIVKSADTQAESNSKPGMSQGKDDGFSSNPCNGPTAVFLSNCKK
ncbi:MAG: AAA family ATPase [Gammaproteobacteria bacterium]|nr:AAA family ATPase [Gammaproteobacteria bacterium]